MSATRTNQGVTRSHCSFCLEAGHTVRSCCHIDVKYLYHEFMYLYRRYGEQFLCNNLSILFQPHEAQALLYHPPINSLRIINNRNVRRMVVDVMMPRDISNRYFKLHKKILSMVNQPLTQLQRDYLPYMDVVEHAMSETIQLHESMDGVIHQGDVLVGYNNHFTSYRHARFRCYDYEICYQRAASIPLPEGLYDFPDYLPPPLTANYDNGRYGRARVIILGDLIPNLGHNDVDVLISLSSLSQANGEEPEPEWLEARPPRNVTIRPHRPFHMGTDIITTDMYQIMFEQWSDYARIFDETYKYAQPEVEIQIIPQPLTASVECPICMTEMDCKESVSLGCCVYSFCGDCYSNQYLTKDHRAHQCMMCRTPFSKIQVYQESVAEKLKPKPIGPMISQRTPSQLTEMDDETFSDLS